MRDVSLVVKTADQKLTNFTLSNQCTYKSQSAATFPIIHMATALLLSLLFFPNKRHFESVYLKTQFYGCNQVCLLRLRLTRVLLANTAGCFSAISNYKKVIYHLLLWYSGSDNKNDNNKPMFIG